MFALGVIPARGGSKGLPGKNLRPLGGLPLIGWSIRAAQRSARLTRTVVSTDDAAIAEAARACGAEVPFTRPPELATDEASIIAVMQHAVRWFEGEEKRRPDIAVLLQPTSPFRTAEDIDGCLRLMEETGADSVETVLQDPVNPFDRFYLKDGLLVPWSKDTFRYPRRQDAPPVYLETGDVYAMRYPVLMEEGKVAGPRNAGFIIPEDRWVDIDTADDFLYAQWLVERRPELVRTAAPRPAGTAPESPP
ncbi:MAG: acylneuraminate cytidylyltransferase family protein [Elusimicrobia bacterium]|nr:acylneuraminate cytidylyltransferase family protein [Elusimicrobiota bacterium]